MSSGRRGPPRVGQPQQVALAGRFHHSYWFAPGIEHGNPVVAPRFRVNAPEVSLNPEFMHRAEVRGNGMMQIYIDEDLSLITDAALQVEYWGGHPGTTNKRVTVNGRTTYALRETGTATGHCTQSHMVTPLKTTDLVNGYNVFQFACDQGESFWGHFIVDDAALRIGLRDDHPDVHTYGLDAFDAVLRASAGAGETVALSLVAPTDPPIAKVVYIGYFDGYDENGTSSGLDWHGITQRREEIHVLATATEPPYSGSWDLSMVPDQDGIGVAAIVHFDLPKEIDHLTPVVRGLATPARPAEVWMRSAADLPIPFWSRVGRRRGCRIPLDVDPAGIERAELRVVVWDGGAGTVETPFTLNGHPLPIESTGDHMAHYHTVSIDPGLLRRGSNEFAVLSDTEHHGIEVLLPGPALVMRRGIG